MKKVLIAAASIGVLFAGVAQADKWDMPMAYAATNFHSDLCLVVAI